MKLPVATVVKPHGIKGELNILLAEMAEPDEDFAPGACLIIEIEGLDVPFFVKSSRSRGGDSLLLSLDEINDEKEAAALAGKTLFIYADPESIAAEGEEGDLTAGALIGYEIRDSDSGATVGRVADLTELTPGCWYFILEGSEKLIPAVDDMIVGVDTENRVVTMDLPEGLAEL